MIGRKRRGVKVVGFDLDIIRPTDRPQRRIETPYATRLGQPIVEAAIGETLGRPRPLVVQVLRANQLGSRGLHLLYRRVGIRIAETSADVSNEHGLIPK